MSLINLSGESYELDRDGSVFDISGGETCDHCGQTFDDTEGEWYSEHGWLCPDCIDELDADGEDDDDY